MSFEFYVWRWEFARLRSSFCARDNDTEISVVHAASLSLVIDSIGHRTEKSRKGSLGVLS